MTTGVLITAALISYTIIFIVFRLNPKIATGIAILFLLAATIAAATPTSSVILTSQAFSLGQTVPAEKIAGYAFCLLALAIAFHLIEHLREEYKNRKGEWRNE